MSYKNSQFLTILLILSLDSRQADIGLLKMGTNELFGKMAITSLIIILTGIQINFFHKKFMNLTSETSVAISKEPEGPKEAESSTKISNFKRRLEFFFLFLEIHFIKLIFIVAFYITIHNVSVDFFSKVIPQSGIYQAASKNSKVQQLSRVVMYFFYSRALFEARF